MIAVSVVMMVVSIAMPRVGPVRSVGLVGPIWIVGPVTAVVASYCNSWKMQKTVKSYV